MFTLTAVLCLCLTEFSACVSVMALPQMTLQLLSSIKFTLLLYSYRMLPLLLKRDIAFGLILPHQIIRVMIATSITGNRCTQPVIRWLLSIISTLITLILHI